MDTPLRLAQVALLGLGLGIVALDVFVLKHGRRFRLSRVVLMVVSVVALAALVLLSLDHLTFPLHLEVMEGTVLAHFERAVSGQFIYTDPSPEFVALAYNPLYYYVSTPLSPLFGVSLFALRLSALIGLAGSALMVFVLVRRRTGSAWWGMVALGLFAAAAGVMDFYLTTAHSDSWFLFMVLLGSALIDWNRGRAWNLAGVLVLVAGFWFKQHGALFAAGGVLFLTFREMVARGWGHGLRSSLPYWATALVLGPVAYAVLGPALFGPRFVYFTWTVPSQWSELGISTFYRLGTFILQAYALPALISALYVVWALLRPVSRLNIVHVQVVIAGLSALMGALDGGSANNVFIPMGTWFLIASALGLHEFTQNDPRLRRVALAMVALFACFALMFYNPLVFKTAPDAQSAYVDLVGLIDGLDGSVYSPDVAVLEQDNHLYPNVHWVALEDLLRGPGRDTRNQPLARELLAPLLAPESAAYVLSNLPLEDKDALAFLTESYVLETDFGDRFSALSAQPGRFFTGYPRYLYRYAGES